LLGCPAEENWSKNNRPTLKKQTLHQTSHKREPSKLSPPPENPSIHLTARICRLNFTRRELGGEGLWLSLGCGYLEKNKKEVSIRPGKEMR